MSADSSNTSADALLLLIDSDGRILDVNEQACLTLGYGADALRSLRIPDIDDEFPPERWPEHWRELRAAKTLRFRVTQRRRDGSPVPVEVFSYLIHLDGRELECAVAHPIRADRIAELALQESEARLALALSVSGQGLFDLDLSTGEALFGDDYAQMLGYAPSELRLTYRLWATWLHPQERHWVLRTLDDCVSGRRSSFDAEYRLFAKCGEWVWVRSVGRVVERDPTGKPLRLVGTNQDVTERRRTEEALRLTQFAVDRAFVGIFWFDPRGNLLYANEQACRSLGYSRDELQGAKVTLFDPGFPEEKRAALWEELRATGSATFVSRHRRKDGSSFPVEVGANYIQLDGEEYNFAFVRDITERQLAEQALRESEARFRSIFDFAPLGVALVEGAEGLIVFSNPRFQQMLGYSPEELAKLRVEDITHPDDLGRDLEQYRALLEDRISSYSMEKRYQCKDGLQIWVDLTVSAIRDDAGRPKYALGMVEDISQRKLMHRALQASESFLDSIISQSPLALVIYDRSGRIARINESAQELFSVADDEFVRSYNLFEDEQFREQGHLALFERVFEQGETVRFQTRYDPLRAKLADQAQPRVEVDLDSTTFPVRDPNGAVTYAVSFHADIGPLMSAERRLRHHLDLEQGLAEISALMIKPAWDDMAERIVWALERLGALTRVDRACLLSIAPDGLTMDATHEWCAAGVETRIGDLRGLAVADLAGRWGDRVPDVAQIRTAELPEGDRLKAVLNGVALQSLLVVPVIWGGRPHAFIGLDTAEIARDWREEDLRLLRMVAETFAHTLQHIESDRALRSSARFLEDLDRVSRVLTRRKPGADVMRELVDVMLDIFQADRVFLLHPCDPEAPAMRVRVEAARPEWPEALAKACQPSPDGVDFAADETFRAEVRRALSQDGPVTFDGGMSSELPEPARSDFMQSQLAVALYPQGDQPWLLGVQQCAYRRAWSGEERRLLKSIAERVSDALAGYLLLEQLQASEERYRSLFTSMTEGFAIGELIQDASGATHDFRLIEVNAGFRHQTGLSADVLTGSGREIFPRMDARDLAAFERAVRFGETAQLEYETERGGKTFELFVYRPAPGRFALLCRNITERRAMEAALREGEARWHQLAESMPNLVWTCDPEGACDYLSTQWLDYTGVSEAIQLGDGWLRQVHPDDMKRLRGAWSEASASCSDFTEEFRIRRHDGTWHWFMSRAKPIRDESGRVVKWYGSSTEIEALKRTEAALRDAKDTREAILQNMTDALMIANPIGQVVSLNAAALRLLGFSSEQEGCRSISDYVTLFHVRDLGGEIQPPEHWPLARALRGEVFTGHELCIERRDNGRIVIASHGGAPIRDENGFVRFGVVTARDVTEQKRAEEKIRYLAEYDTLTQLPNRRLLQERLRRHLAQAKRRGSKLAVMVLDLDHFKEINDSLGHAVGDAFLCEAARRMVANLRETDTVARTGGDEFVVVLPDTDADGAAQLAQRMLDGLGQPLTIDNQVLSITCSLGISLYPDNGTFDHTLIERADMALYKSKQEGRNRLHFFNKSMQEQAIRSLTVKQELRQALTRNELLLFYQPQIDLRTGRTIGLEALLRWQHPRRGLMTPGEFLPIAEESELINDLGSWVLETVISQIEDWDRRGLPAMPVAINVSARQFRRPHHREAMMDQLLRMLERREVGPTRLELEVTEESLMQGSEETLDALMRLHELGVRLAIDDFGSGYSSLHYLRSFPLDRLKIAHTYVQELAVNARDEAIVDIILTLGRNLGFEVIAEGVETTDQLTKLSSMGCVLGQGYLFSCPLEPGKAEIWLRRAQQDETPLVADLEGQGSK